MSLFSSLMGDFENDPIFGMHMRSMRQMNNMMNSLFADPFGMMNDFQSPAALTHRPSSHHNALMPFGGMGYPAMPNMNRLLGGSLDSLGGGDCHSYSSTSVVSMSSGPDGRPQVYRASQSTRVAPGGVREVQRTECDSRTGTKKMAIGHHIGERAHVIEREQNVLSGDQEEREDFINIEEEEADDFNREWETKVRVRPDIPRLTNGGGSRVRHSPLNVPAITAGPTSRRSRSRQTTPIVSPRRTYRPASLALTSSTSSTTTPNRSPYSPPGGQHHQHHSRKNRNVKSVSGPPNL